LKYGDLEMASNRKKTKRIRENKAKPNKQNLKANMARIKKNEETLKDLASNE